MKRTRTKVCRTSVLMAAGLLTLVLGSQAETQITLPFDLPATYAYTHSSEAYDVTFDDIPLIKTAYAQDTNGGHLGLAEAVASLNGKRGFRALAAALSPNQDPQPAGGVADVGMDFIVTDPLGQNRGKVVVEFEAIVVAGALDSRYNSSSTFYVEVGRQVGAGKIIRNPDGTEEFAGMPYVFQPPVLTVFGRHYSHPAGDRNFLTISGNGQVIENTSASGPLVYKRKIVVNVPVGAINQILIEATAFGNAFTYVDPVITPHPDNPEVVVTLRGAVDPNPPPLALPSPEELTAAGIDIAPIQELGLFDSPSSLTFLSPLPDASYKVGATIKAKFRLVDASGVPIPDAEAKSLVKACRVKAGLDTATRCARYNAKLDFFLASVKIPKGESVGTHEVVAQVLEPDGTAADSATTAVLIY